MSRFPSLLAMVEGALESRTAEEQAECLAQLGVLLSAHVVSLHKTRPDLANRIIAAMLSMVAGNPGVISPMFDGFASGIPMSPTRREAA